MRNTLYMLCILILALITGFFWGTRWEKNIWFSSENGKAQAKLNRLIRYVGERYVDKVDIDSLSTEVIQEIIGRLDPHTVFIPNEERQSIAETMQGNFVGIGVSFYMVGDTVSVVRVLEGGPSEAAGVLPGDRILKADQDTLYSQGLNSNQIVSKLKGVPESELALEFYRPQTDSLFVLPIQRGEVPIKSVNAAFSVSQSTGYIKINRFASTTYDEFIAALKSFDLYETENLILDLRDNPGGYLIQAQRIADVFLEENLPIVITESNKGVRQRTVASDTGGFETGGVYILVNEQSASAAEVLAGALQDNDRAWIVGRRTFGKGLVQQQLPLGDGDAIRLTTARYYTPTGRSIQRPYTQNKAAYYDEITQRYNSGEMADEENVPYNDSLAFLTPKGRKVYGGGGIYPDIYVPNTNTRDQQWDDYLLRSNLMNHFVFTTLDQDRGDFEFPEEKEFMETPLANQKRWLQDFKTYCKNNGIPLQVSNKERIVNAIKAYLGLQLYGENCHIKILMQQDSFLKKALNHQKNTDE